MKKIFLLFAMAGTVAFTGCSSDDDQPQVIQNNYPEFVASAFELNNVDLTFEPSTGRFEYLTELGQELYPADVVLVYRRVAELNTMVWQQMPRIQYIDLGNEDLDEVDYDFNFTRQDILIYSTATFNLINEPSFIDNQSFRVVIVPADFLSGSRIDLNDYNAVMNRLNIKESDVKVIGNK